MKNVFLFTLFYISTTAVISAQHFQGTWTKINTTYLFDFNLHLNIDDNNKVVGYFIWEVIRYDEKDAQSKRHYEKKIGLTAKEFVTGTYAPDSGEYFLKGTNKDDRHFIIGLDTYRLKEDENGNLEGTTKANNSWLGRIKGRRGQVDF